MTAVRFFRCQWNFLSCRSTALVSFNCGTASGPSSSESRTASLNATVMPPPVRGWRMFIASPIITNPGVVLVLGGSQEFGIDRSLPFSMAALNAGCVCSGRFGTTTLVRCAFTPPFLIDADGVFSGISTSARVS